MIPNISVPKLPSTRITMPVIMPPKPIITPSPRLTIAKPFTTCSAPKSLLDSNEGDTFEDKDLTLKWSDGQAQLGQIIGADSP